jgi:hypothetical protein
MITLHWWQLVIILILAIAFGVYLEAMFRHIKNMTNEYDGGEP